MPQTAFIWDLDGTLLDSYDAIMEALDETYKHYHLPFDADFIRHYILQESVGQLLDKMAKQQKLSPSELKAFFTEEQQKRDCKIKLLPFAKEVLQWGKEKGIEQFIYTHKGASTNAVLAELGIEDYFTEVLTSVSGFKRKPHPQGIFYLLEKYALNKEHTYYIGDRRLDVEVAENAGIQSLNLVQPSSPINQKIENLWALTQLNCF
ncbi:HAD-IA family hydrolase [Streptococcus ratti]|uniref:HAD-IA family hydrolase n=2 Tax=Streptococcus ratti TaxID=1341 RepID=A0A7X9LCC4_STRRT|nr:HAD-IA family hydrolase [Streptococcus ratti]VEI60616.1 phosphatase [Streptococcus mutans]EJN94324.1 putative phosphatase [Streptococcus ratti FA-1 = DSM 20564]EMP70981.1 phosphatase [Streptococcus ratti FA-1 = DSM 20564]NMD48600.1 HAD-IA family hydrolase [Streptococcus ratti]QEY06274.1 HAD-IA family hydrolase [Streptococcus ratti]